MLLVSCCFLFICRFLGPRQPERAPPAIAPPLPGTVTKSTEAAATIRVMMSPFFPSASPVFDSPPHVVGEPDVRPHLGYGVAGRGKTPSPPGIDSGALLGPCSSTGRPRSGPRRRSREVAFRAGPFHRFCSGGSKTSGVPAA